MQVGLGPLADDGSHRHRDRSRRHLAAPDHLRHRTGEMAQGRGLLSGECLSTTERPINLPRPETVSLCFDVLCYYVKMITLVVAEVITTMMHDD